MTRGIAQTLKKHLDKRTIIAVALALVAWGTISFGVVYLKIPIILYLELSDNPWQPVNSETYPETGVAAIDFVDSYHGWIAGEDGMIMATTDGGISWEEQQSGININIRAIDFFNADIGVAISEKDDILITQNGGVSWISLEKAKYQTSSGWKSTILWDVVTCDEYTAWVLGNMGKFFRINIKNQSWSFISDISHYIGHLAMLNNSHGWATGGFGTIVKTTDGWQSYDVQDAGVSTNFRGIFFWDFYKGWIVGFDNTIIATTDGGKDWHVQYTYHPFLADFGSVALLDIYFITESKGWAVGSYGIHYTKDGEKSWYNLGEETWGPSRIAFANETHGWAVGYRKDRSYITSVGGVPAIDENLLNLFVSICIFIGIFTPILIVVALVQFQKHQAQKKGSTNFSERLCPMCGCQTPSEAKFCVNCGEPFPNE
ncbi:MAG: YCF48-related protein [Promethearchaeota archaeon]